MHPTTKSKDRICPKYLRASYIMYKKTKSDGIKIEFPFDQKMIEKVKTLNGRMYHPSLRVWSCPLNLDSLEKLNEWGFDLDVNLRQWLKNQKEANQILYSKANQITIPGFKGKLLPFQQQGLAFLEKKNGKALIADEMGLGKTIQTIAYLQLHPEIRPALIVVPSSLKLNWKKEIEKFTSIKNVQILSGTSPNTSKLNGEVLVINYDILSYWDAVLVKKKIKIMIVDECHFFKNNKAKRTKSIKKLGKFIPRTICLSGTPIINRPVEIFNAVKLIDPNLFPNEWQFKHRYCAAKHNGFGWDFTGSSNTEELHEKLSKSIMIRRLKKDVLKDLPDKHRSFIPIELSNRKEYQFAEQNFLLWVRDRIGADAADKASNAQALAEIESLKQMAVKGKLDIAINWIEDFLLSDEKIVIFATHKFVIDHLMSSFNFNKKGECINQTVKIDGGVQAEDRQKAVERFQNDPTCRVFIGNIKAAGVGLTLTAASNIAFLELPWTPGDLVQAEDRCHRIGQKNNVNIHYLLAYNTIEEKIARLIDEKTKILSKVLDGKKPDQTSLLSELMNSYKHSK